jgi:hypothetical protein
MINAKILRGRVYLLLALTYVVMAFALCLKAPLILRPVQLTSDAVDMESNPTPAPKTLLWDDQSIVSRAPLWAIGSELSLNVSLFATEQAEVLGAALIFLLTYRFKSQLTAWSVRVVAFISSRRRGTCVWLSFATLFSLTLFPPWVQINTFGGRLPAQRLNLWHAPIFHAPINPARWESSEVDYARMLTEIVTGECFVLALYLTWARSKPNTNEGRLSSSKR